MYVSQQFCRMYNSWLYMLVNLYLDTLTEASCVKGVIDKFRRACPIHLTYNMAIYVADSRSGQFQSHRSLIALNEMETHRF